MTIKEYLEKYDISQAEFSRMLGVNFTTVSKWCDGSGRVPKRSNMAQIQKITKGEVTLQDMWREGFVSSLDKPSG
jgi:DNA-binding transcriptional regulator YiaG